MIRALLNHLVSAPSGGSAETALSFEGISGGWAFVLLLALGAAIWWNYRRGARALSPQRRGFLTVLRVLLAVLFVLLLVRPVLMITLNDPVREQLLVLFDDSESMGIRDQRSTPEDVNRAALAANLLAPDAGLQAAAPDDVGKWKNASRADLLRAVTDNPRLRLWTRLAEKADLHFHRFGRELHDLGALPAGAENAPQAAGAAADLLKRQTFAEKSTAFGDAVRQLLEENRGQPVSGLLLVTDGANNTGAPPEEIAELARQDNVPLYTYGIGITGPRDIVVHELAGPRGAFMKERAEFTVNVRAPGFNGQSVTLRLRANGREVDKKEIRLGDSEAEYRLGYEPQEKGEARIEAVIDPLEGESSRENNVASTKIRVLDNQVKVLYVEQEPRWDFRYLLSTLQRDRRLAVKCVLIDGGAELAGDPNTGFLKEFPTAREDLVSNEIIVLGDVDPATLGEAHMKLLQEWVGEIGGGLIFMAGPKQNPVHYANTPLAPLLPVELDPTIGADQWAERSRLPIKLRLTPAGELSPLLRLSDKSLENRQIWNEFPGTHWIARVGRARPTAQVFLEDAGAGGGEGAKHPPVIAQQAYGKGTVMYFGFDETYRWRSRVGEKYYSRIWNQIIQSFSLERQLGASARTQLKVARPEYTVGEKVVISGKLYTAGFAALTEASVPGTLSILPPDANAGTKAETREASLLARPDATGEYQMEFVARTPGEYRFSTILDPNAALKFEVVAPRLEQSQTAMDASLLGTMSQISGGKFLREEDLNGLPDLVASHTMTVPTFKKRELFYSPWWMAALMLLVITEWLFRRLWQLQ